MKKILLILFFVCSPLIAQDAKVTPLMSKDSTDFPGKEGLMIAVEYPPGASDPFIGTTLMRFSTCSRVPS